MTCDCKSYNKPEWGGSVPESVIENEGRPVCVDECIADQILALWGGGVATLGSCCGHNGKGGPSPSVILENPRDVVKAAAILREEDPNRPWQIIVWTSK